ncbi:hypothetical protein [Paenibacillus sp. JNUCC31]|nr:hypothetical protein [Paenibacillus sp. JNUCC-31]
MIHIQSVKCRNLIGGCVIAGMEPGIPKNMRRLNDMLMTISA